MLKSASIFVSSAFSSVMTPLLFASSIYVYPISTAMTPLLSVRTPLLKSASTPLLFVRSPLSICVPPDLTTMMTPARTIRMLCQYL